MTITEVTSTTISLVSNELNGFLRSDSDEIPASLKQLLKVAECREFQQTLTRVSSALTAEVFAERVQVLFLLLPGIFPGI
jgi:hypothetical protein